MKQTALIGPTASGKSDLALKLADKTNAYILSLDSLSVYKEIDIVSAKPSHEELQQIEHFGINVIYPNEPFNAMLFADIYKSLYKKAIEEDRDIILVGGTSFYLKALIDGLSSECVIDDSVKAKVQIEIEEIEKAYSFLQHIDNKYASTITHNDKFRISKALEIYYQTGENITSWFKNNPPKPIIQGNAEIINIDIDKSILHEKIEKRTKKMYEQGLVDEIMYLIKTYTTKSNCMKAIGIKETIDYINGDISSSTELIERISKNTKKLAKRQMTFNRTQFKNIKPLSNSPLSHF